MFGREQHQALRRDHDDLSRDSNALRVEVHSLAKEVADLKDKLMEKGERYEQLRLTVVGLGLRLDQQAEQTAKLAAALMDRIDLVAKSRSQ